MFLLAKERKPAAPLLRHPVYVELNVMISGAVLWLGEILEHT